VTLLGDPQPHHEERTSCFRYLRSCPSAGISSSQPLQEPASRRPLRLGLLSAYRQTLNREFPRRFGRGSGLAVLLGVDEPFGLYLPVTQ
jgi:hypothetical protein